MVDLKKVRGIGDKLANRIIKYRKILGGFYTEGQLYDVYGLDSNTVVSLAKRFVFEGGLRKILLNSASYEEFAG